MSVDSVDFGEYIASYPDFPKAGILFRDISPLLASAKGMVQAIDQFAAQLSDFNIDLIAGIEARGFLFSTLLASRLNIGSMMVRKPGKLPGKLVRTGYDLEYGTAELTIQQDVSIEGRSVLIIDDLLATGGTMVAAKTLLESCGAIVPVCAVVIELVALGGRAALGMPLITLKAYDD
ncbi:adenine phosphoribosyltransferase [Alphaproteobacteria bacterium]|nr:adenine phosphoribosyltransferase [Alphaproteobacteria bacterium]